MAVPWLNALPIAGTLIEGWQTRRQAKLDSEVRINQAVTDAKIKHMQDQQAADISWENTSLATAGIKDEVMMFIILAPMVACFLPGGAVVVKNGFAAMQAALPWYWEYGFLTVLAASFGVRKALDFIQIRRGV